MKVRGVVLLVLLSSLVSAQIKHVIVLMEENRSFDHFLGWYPGANGLTGDEYNLINQSNPNSERVYVDKLARDVAPCDPDHSVPSTTAKIFGIPATEAGNFTDPDMSGFVQWEYIKGNEGTHFCAVMSTFTPQELPIMATLASEFVLMDRFFCAVPGPTWPNRLFMLSGTSAGLTETGGWYQDKLGQLFPQMTIFDQVASEGLSWKHYFNDTPWELFLSSVVHNPENVQSLEQFYIDAAEGNLPNFAWINPRAGVNVTSGLGSNDDHPDHDVALGEQYYKDIYEAIRASPNWNETLFIITYDEHGGFYDHVPPPMNVPPPDNIPSYPDKNYTFDRLGVRIPTLLISPWVPKGLILSEPPEAQKPAPNSEYTLTSIIATARKVLGMTSGPLTKRDAWSATFEQVLNQSSPRTDCPMHLPSAPPPSRTYSPEAEAMLPVNGLQKDIMMFHANMMGEEFPDHIEVQGEVSEWAQGKFFEHCENHKRWKEAKMLTGPFTLLVQPGDMFRADGIDWDLNNSTEVAYSTLSVNNDSACLDYNINNYTVSVSPCYPSWKPETNRDTSQHWVWGTDAMIRPYDYPTLCLTNHYPTGDPKIYLETCNFDNVEQHYSWQGATNMGTAGSMGWGPFSVGIMSTEK